LAERTNLKIGQAVKLIFDIELADKQGNIYRQIERMWVVVSEIVDGGYIGLLNNQPASFEPSDEIYLCFGAEIPFKAEHVVDITQLSEAYIQWQLGLPSERKWPRS